MTSLLNRRSTSTAARRVSPILLNAIRSGTLRRKLIDFFPVSSGKEQDQIQSSGSSRKIPEFFHVGRERAEEFGDNAKMFA